jgi:hypothetical protein
LIHNGIFAAPASPSALAIPLVKFRFWCSAVAQTRRIHLTAAGYIAAGLATVFVSAITMAADAELSSALR